MVLLRRINCLRPGLVARVALAVIFIAGPLDVTAKPMKASDRAEFERGLDEIKSTMLADPVRAERLAAAAAASAAAWPSGSQRDLALSEAQWLQGEGAYRTNHLAVAAPLINSALITAERVAPSSKLNADVLLSSARIAIAQGRPQIGLLDLQHAYNIFVKLGDARSEAKALQSIGSLYQDAQDFERVLSYYRQARDVYPSDPTLGLSASNNMANAYAQTGRRDEAMREYRRALDLARQLKSPLLTAQILDNIGDLEVVGQKFTAARATISEGLALARDPKAATRRPMLLGTLARLEIAQGNPAAAVRAVEDAFAGVEDAAINQAFRPVHLTAYNAYRLNGDDRRALEHLEAFRTLDDAERTLATSTSAALIAARFDSANKDNRLTKAAVVLAQLEARQRTLLLAGLLVLVAGATLFLIVYLKSLRRSRNNMVAANLQLAETNSELADALLAKSQFLATTSHEIRTPLNGILGMTQVMLADRTVAGELRDRIGLVNSAGRAMRTLVDDILDFAKMDSGALAIETAPVDIAAVMPDLVSLWQAEATEKGVRLDLDIEHTIPPVLTDIVRVRQIVFNLLSNAVKFTVEGSVRVVVSRTIADSAEWLEIAFCDTGVGVPQAAFESIFEPFRQLDTSTTRRFGGTGLGLAISRHLARALGGDIRVESVLSVGSTFVLRLPLTRAEAIAAVIRPDRCDRDRPRLQIIVANPIGRSMLRTRLDPHFDGCSACDVDEAVDRIDETAPDLALIDTDGIDDVRLLALLDRLGTRHDLSVAVLRASTATLDIATLHAHGAASVIAKPVSVDELVAALYDLSSREIAVPAE